MINLLPPALRRSIHPLACTGAGLFIGQVVMGLSAHHHGSLAGLGFALVFLVSSAAAVTFALLHLHGQVRPSERAPLERWLLLLAAGVLASIWLAGGLPG